MESIELELTACASARTFMKRVTTGESNVTVTDHGKSGWRELAPTARPAAVPTRRSGRSAYCVRVMTGGKVSTPPPHHSEDRCVPSIRTLDFHPEIEGSFFPIPVVGSLFRQQASPPRSISALSTCRRYASHPTSAHMWRRRALSAATRIDSMNSSAVNRTYCDVNCFSDRPGGPAPRLIAS
jgi:hypothetical protein